ncbi:hypothetical protein F5X98DRAFT_357027 [Xylaria grammica]|nr:hypothetical protein F5X98DRAFT_357027 [Xylaria grammica]
MLLSLLFILLPLVRSAALDARQSSRDDCRRAMQLVEQSSEKIIDGQAAQDCLLSLPFDTKKAGQFLTEIRKYIQFQSTLEVLKNPPDTYLSPAVDILGGLDKIGNTVYTNQYQFDFDLRTLIRSATDGHFLILPCSLNAFTFFRQEASSLVSVSQDGLAQPEIYAATDVGALSSGSARVSPVTKINGQDVTEYLDTVAAPQANQDPDARWNTLFASLAAVATGNSDLSSFWGEFVSNDGLWPGVGGTTLEFKNGTTRDIPTLAQYNFEDTFPSSTALYEEACIPGVSQNPQRSTRTKRDAKVVTPAGPLGFPTPFIREPYNQISGYTLDNDTAIMFIPTFEGGPDFPDNQDFIFAQTAQKLVNKAVGEGRTKLIIDLSRNGGGDTSRAFDLFKLFFPSQLPYSANRFRRHDALDLLVLSGQKTPVDVAGINPFAYLNAVNADQDAAFASVEDFLEGEVEFGGNVTAISANFNFTLFSELNADTGPIRGFGGTPINNTQPYAPEDILIVTDGFCASTCAIFVNLMTRIGGVRSLTFGGRPRSEPMQVIGGVRGSQVYKWSEIASDVAAAIALVNDDPSLLTKDQIALANAVWPIPLDEFPLVVGDGDVNLRSAYQEGADHLPLQFDYQASDCRLFYTAKNIMDPSSTWADAKAAIWGDHGCVTNSTGGRGSLEDRSKSTTNSSSRNNGNSGGNSSSVDDNDGGEGGNGAGSLHIGSTLLALCVGASMFSAIM